MQWKPWFPKAAFAAAITTIVLVATPGWTAEEAAPAPEAEPELVIVKYGSVFVKCDEPGAKVYIDDTYKGGAESVIESIVTGEHVISCRIEDKTVSGTFQIKKNETLRLEANFDEGKLVREQSRSAAPEPAEKKKPAPVKQEKPKKPVPPPKKAELKNPVEERRNNHLNVMRITYEVTDSQDVKITPASNATVISKYSSNKNRSGKYYHTKQGVLLCDSGPCEINWSAKFAYTDENGKEDALLLKWKETVFNGITPAGTSKQELECCLNGQCWKMQEDSKTETQEFSIGERYRLAWNKSSLIIRRSDIMKEVLDAGRSLSDY